MAALQRNYDTEGRLPVALEELIGAHGDRLLRSAYLLCGDRTEAEDLVQETLLQAIKSFHRFRGDSAVYTWLHGILRNLCHRHFRAQKHLVLGQELDLHQAPQSETSDDIDQEFCSAKLTQALQKLSPEHREVIVLRYYENLKVEEISRQTGITKGTVKSRLHYAARCLEELLPDEMNVFAPHGTQNKGTS